ncbi:MAG: class I SAM-dependent methyltransferase [Parcubacteria group bacterium]|jgi:2-polyprenyl-3-methyl-5-hydroxy-6-metoxy-1,4-benzoquinol methylase
MFCKHEKRKNILKKDNFSLSECLLCGLIFLEKENENIDLNIYKNYYKKETGKRFGAVAELAVKAFRFLRALKVFILKPKGKKIIDIGSGRGWMLYFLKKYFGYKTAIGTQISENAYEFSKEKLGLEIYNKDLLDLEFNVKFDAITLWHILEHVPEPESYVEKLTGMIDDDGLLMIETPNFNSWSRILAKNRWLAMDPKHHTTFFTPDSLKSLLEKYNFKIKKIGTFSLEYSAFTSAQSIINLITGTDNYFFEWLQKKDFNLKIILHALLFTILFPVCFLANLVLYFSKNGEVINVIAEKNEQQ